ncbi:hypothetical protein K9763_19515 [Clostridioides difficile]|nr:hypothetical protein [Clostridioides difficile]MDI2847287.1 hypothetical protein [Clostridioides difficile]
MDYRAIINNFAYNSLNNTPDIPDLHLMVGCAERLDSIPVLLFTDYFSPAVQNKAVVNAIDYTPWEKVNPDLQGEKITMEMFPTESFYLGDVRGDLY